MSAASEIPETDAEAAFALARDLAAGAVWADGVCAFHGAGAPAELGLPVPFRAFGGDLYEGSAGVARFLACVARLGGDAELARVARGAIGHAFARAEGWSLFSGGLGIGLVALELAEWLEAPDLVPPAVRLIERASAAALAEARAGTAPADLLAGLAGVVLGLVAAEPYDLDGDWPARARAIASALAAQAVQRGAGLAWPLAPGGELCLCGLGHGASGVALAFEALGDPAFAAAARRARAFERGWYAPEFGSWADLRGAPTSFPDFPPCPRMWCHGSVGIAAERLRADPGDPLARADLAGALAGIRVEIEALVAGPRGPAAGDGINGSQCHGLGGMSDLLIDVWLRTGDADWLALARAATGALREDARRPGGWRCGVPGGEATPGLMLGLAGIGWAQLRAAHPEAVPSAWAPAPGRVLAGTPTR